MPAAPDTIDLSNGGGAWPAIVISGAVDAPGVNTTWTLDPYAGAGSYSWRNAANTTVSGQAGIWSVEGTGTVEYFGGDGLWPWSPQTWTPSNGASGTLAFARAIAAPSTLDLAVGGASVEASLSTNLTGANNDLDFVAIPPGRLGNDIRVRYVDPAANNAALSVSLAGRDITVSLATNGGGTITSTAALIETALEASPAAALLITVANAAANDGTGVVTAMAWTNLTGGTGGLPLPPDTITL